MHNKPELRIRVEIYDAATGEVVGKDDTYFDEAESHQCVLRAEQRFHQNWSEHLATHYPDREREQEKLQDIEGDRF